MEGIILAHSIASSHMTGRVKGDAIRIASPNIGDIGLGKTKMVVNQSNMADIILVKSKTADKQSNMVDIAQDGGQPNQYGGLPCPEGVYI